MFVSESMTSKLITLTPAHRIYHALEAMETQDIRHIPIVKEGTQSLLGIVSDRDIKRHLNHSFDTDAEVLDDRLALLTPLQDIMSSEVITVSPEDDILETLRSFVHYKISAVPVVQEGTKELVGILTSQDLLELFFESLLQEPTP